MFIKGHWDTEAFVAAYLNIPLVLALYLGHKPVMKTKILPLE